MFGTSKEELGKQREKQGKESNDGRLFFETQLDHVTKHEKEKEKNFSCPYHDNGNIAWKCRVHTLSFTAQGRLPPHPRRIPLCRYLRIHHPRSTALELVLPFHG